MRHVVASLLVGVVLALGEQADAQVVTFDELAPTENPILGSVVCADGTGFRFFSDHFHLTGVAFAQDYTYNGTTHIGYESGRGFPITMERVGGGTFSLLSFDAAEFYAVSVIDRPDAEMITIVGVQQGGGMVSHTVNIDGIHDGPGGAVDFEHVVLPATFVNLTSVVFTGLRAGGASGGIAIDNIAYELASPETLAACTAIPLPPDTPTIAIVSPAAGNVSGTTFVEAAASDNVGVVSVQFRLDGVDLGPADVEAPYAISWDTTAVPDGPHTLTAEARDAANNVGTASVMVTVRNNEVVTSPHYLDLDGVDDYLIVADADGLSFGNGTADTPLTIEMWFRPDAMGRHQLLGKWNDNATAEYKLHIASGIIRLDLRDASAQAMVSAHTTNSYLSLIGSWHHLAVTYDGRGGASAANGVSFYIDGVAVPVTRINSAAYVAMENLAAPLQIGRESAGWKQYDGALDELRLWNVARTPSEIQSYLTTELTGAEPGLAGYWRLNDGAGAAADDSAVGRTATLFNGPAWVAGGPMGPAEPDTTPPAIAGIVTTNLTASGITIAFTTSEAATAWVSYTPGPSCPCDVSSAAPGTTHTVTLTGLAPDTDYQFFVRATDAAGNPRSSPAMTFRTLALPSDPVPPAVSIASPSAGTVSGTTMVEASATDNVGVVSVQFRLDGADLGPADMAAPYAISWDTTTVADGAHTLTAEARDAANNLGTASVAVVVQNGVVVSSPHHLELDGVDDHLLVADADGLSFGNSAADTPLTIEMWFRPDAMGRHQLLGKWGDNASAEYKLHIASGILRLDLRDASTQAMVSAYTTNGYTSLIGSWHHLAVVYDGRGGAAAANGVSFYIDGLSVPVTRINNAAYVAMENLGTPLQIGRESAGWKQYDGALDELRLWSVARTASQIQAFMTTELSGVEPGLAAYWRLNEGAGVTVADSSPAGRTGTLFGAAWVPGGPMAPPEPDTTPPDITNIVVANLTDTSVTITFTTSEPATAWVSYSAGASCPCTHVYSAATGTSHVVTLSGLSADTDYQFVVNATDAASNTQTSPATTFRTFAEPPDAIPPSISFVSPSGGNVSDTVAVEASAADNVGVTGVQFKLDGVDVGAVDDASPYSIQWDTTAVADGPHTLTAEARDAANNVTVASVAVIVRNHEVVTTPHHIDLDGVDDHLLVADGDGLSFGDGTADTPLTIEMWFRPDAMGRHQLLGKWADNASAEYKLHIASGIIRLDLRDASAQAMVSVHTTSSYLSLIGSWHHLAVTYDGRGGPAAANGVSIYIDGVSVPVTRINNASYVAMENLAASLQIGRESASWKQYDGGLDELRLWRVARTAAEIQSLMTAGLSGLELGLAAYWPLDEGAGTTATDRSPAGRTATLANGAAWVPGGPSIP